VYKLKIYIHYPLYCRLNEIIGSKPRDVKVRTKTEKLLLETYGQNLPEPVHPGTFSSIPDSTSVSILKRFHPVVLEETYPAETTADVNCFYRAVSRALTGTEAYHVLLRLYTLLEILSFPMYYDSSHTKFVDLIQDNRIVVATYTQLAYDVGNLSRYADMMHMYALSAAIRLPIRSYFPPQLALEFLSQPHSRKVCGRGVNTSAIPACTIMWTRCKETLGPFIPNHFVPLLKRQPDVQPVSISIDDSLITECEDIQPEPESTDQISAPYEDLLFDMNSALHQDNSEALQSDNLCPFIDNSDSDDIHPLSHGCLDRSFLETEDVVKLLTTYSESEAHDRIPEGSKNDVYFVIKNSRN